MHRYTPEQVAFLTNNVVGRSSKELLSMFNTHFELGLKLTQIRAFVKNHGLKSGIDCTFKLGSVPFNKGQKGLGGWEPTQFKKGNRPHNYKPVGTERVNGEDYVDIKIADPNKWRSKHLVVWEQENGTVPKSHVVIFGDGNRRNFGLDNLILISRKQLAVMNKNGLIQKDADMTRTGIIVANLHMRISERNKARKEVN